MNICANEGLVSFDLTNKSFKRRKLFFFHRVKMRSIRNSWFLLKNKQLLSVDKKKVKRFGQNFKMWKAFIKF